MARGDGHALANHLANDTVWHLVGDGPLAGSYHGRDAVFGLLKRVAAETNRSFRVDVLHILADDHYAVALTHGTGRRGTSSYSGDGVSVYRLKPDGTIAEAWLYQKDQGAYDRFWS